MVNAFYYFNYANYGLQVKKAKRKKKSRLEK